jgi:hypothetical protein
VGTARAADVEVEDLVERRPGTDEHAGRGPVDGLVEDPVPVRRLARRPRQSPPACGRAPRPARRTAPRRRGRRRSARPSPRARRAGRSCPPSRPLWGRRRRRRGQAGSRPGLRRRGPAALPDGATADAKLGGELRLRKVRARRQLPRPDRVLDQLLRLGRQGRRPGDSWQHRGSGFAALPGLRLGGSRVLPTVDIVGRGRDASSGSPLQAPPQKAGTGKEGRRRAWHARRRKATVGPLRRTRADGASRPPGRGASSARFAPLQPWYCSCLRASSGRGVALWGAGRSPVR